jgi:thiol-disulfide isomerase/thioredoxin
MATPQPAKANETANVKDFSGTLEELRAQISSNDGLTVVIFFAQWCAPSRRLTGPLPQLALENPKVTFIKIDVVGNADLAEYYKISGIPNVRLFKGRDAQKEPIQILVIEGLDNIALREAVIANSK